MVSVILCYLLGLGNHTLLLMLPLSRGSIGNNEVENNSDLFALFTLISNEWKLQIFTLIIRFLFKIILFMGKKGHLFSQKKKRELETVKW